MLVHFIPLSICGMPLVEVSCRLILLALKYYNASRWLHVYFRDVAVKEQEFFFIICYVPHGTSGVTRGLSMSGASRIYTWRDSGVITFALFFLCRLPNQLLWFMFMALTPHPPKPYFFFLLLPSRKTVSGQPHFSFVSVGTIDGSRQTKPKTEQTKWGVKEVQGVDWIIEVRTSQL